MFYRQLLTRQLQITCTNRVKLILEYKNYKKYTIYLFGSTVSCFSCWQSITTFSNKKFTNSNYGWTEQQFESRSQYSNRLKTLRQNWILLQCNKKYGQNEIINNLSENFGRVELDQQISNDIAETIIGSDFAQLLKKKSLKHN